MTSLWKNVLGGCMLVGATTLVTTQVVSQDAPPSNLGDMPPAAQKAMERYIAWEKHGYPGPEHERMKQGEGLWLNDGEMWMFAGAPATPMNGIAKMSSILGDRFMLEESTFVMDIEGQQQVGEGLGIFGYDNYKKQHFFIWLSNGGTTPMFGYGDRDANGDIVYYSKFPDMTDGSFVEYKSISRDVNSDEHEFLMYERQGDGSWAKHLRIVGHRKG